MLEKIKENKTVIILLIIAVYIAIMYTFGMPKENIKETNPEEAPRDIIEEEPKTVKVDIKGQVKNPGVYELDANSRVIDVIELSGGVNNNADNSLINLSKKIKDEMVIIVYSKIEVQKLKEDKIKECVCPASNDACITNEKQETLTEKQASKTDNTSNGTNDKISINTATLEQLQTLTGIGEAKAEAIIEYRMKNGLFTTIEEIKNVAGIGESIFEKIKDNITI